MGEFIKVCELDDLPPGQGKRVHIGDQSVYLFNREGRIAATLEEHRLRGAQAAEVTSCQHNGTRFEVEQEDSPARMRADVERVRVRIEEGSVYVALEAAEVPAAGVPQT